MMAVCFTLGAMQGNFEVVMKIGECVRSAKALTV
jgi:hypothetical protein